MMEHLIHSRLSKILGIAILSTAALYGQTALAEDSGLESMCMEDRAVYEGQVKHLNCTANDIRIASASNIKIIQVDGQNVPSTTKNCISGKPVTFSADFDVVSTASERYDIGLYFNNAGGPNARVGYGDSPETSCTSYTLDEDTVNATNLDMDSCWDAEQAAQIVKSVTITTACIDTDGDNQLNLPNCVSWRQPGANELCEDAKDAYPGAPSKCNCDDDFNIPIFIDPPTITKTLLSSSASGTEPGKEFDFEVSFKNNNGTSVFIHSLSDEFDIGSDDTYSDKSLDLWGATTVVNSDTPEGIYLTATSCTQPPDTGNGVGEIKATATYSCEFSVHIVQKTITPDPLLFDDVVLVTFKDEDGDALTNGQTCPSSLTTIDGEFCSNEESVNLTGVPPTIEVIKTADPTEVLEPGGNVEFTITVENTSSSFDSPLTLTELGDTEFGDLLDATEGECKDVSTSIPFGGTYTCTFTKFIGGNAGDDHDNTVTAWAKDDEGTSVKGMYSAHVDINDVPSVITIEKTANPTSVPETGDDPNNEALVTYTFKFIMGDEDGVNDGVDYVDLKQLVDDMFGDLTSECFITDSRDGPVANMSLVDYRLYPNDPDVEPDPGPDWASCEITKGITGNFGDDPHVNKATIYGIDGDGQAVEDDDIASVSFDEEGPQTDVALASRLLVVLELTNPGVENVKLTALTVNALSVFSEEFNANFSLLNTGGDYGPVYYGPCVEGSDLLYNGAPSDGDKYSCAFTIELKPGLENTDPVDVTGTLAVTVTDDDGTDLTNSVSAQVITVE